MTVSTVRQYQIDPHRFGIVAVVQIKNTTMKQYHIYHIDHLGTVYHYGKSYDDIIEAALKAKEIAKTYFKDDVYDKNW